ncbi:DNA ligase [Agaribacter flavus]|uniref:DNA ligase n=1 Tax=Agaribacter flavus TaxID=1902781 RepID=A0ABV7FSA7_9ALTE
MRVPYSQWKWVVFVLITFLSHRVVAEPHLGSNLPQVQLAKVFKGHDVSEYLVSEKYDGVRAIWKNKKLVTRNGHRIYAPAWFTEGWPDTWFDGELWFARGNFEYVMSTVSKDIPLDKEWRNIRFMVFDQPNNQDTFEQRYRNYNTLVEETQSNYLLSVKQLSFTNNHSLFEYLQELVDAGAEGLMLHKKNALFESGRTGNVIKLKTHQDSEAKVLRHIEGQGKYKGLLGALYVEWLGSDGKAVRFKIGSGFSDLQRANPPTIGSQITFKYYGLTRRGIPKYASFIRVRSEVNQVD